ncbi:MAG: ATP-binding protein [bacterium]
MEDISLHILDIAENSIRAGAKKIRIEITEDTKVDILTIAIIDDGKGMDIETLKKATSPFFSTKGKKIGLGLSLLAQSAKEAEGSFSIESKPDKGTKVFASFKLSHIDRKPLGNIGETIKTLIVANPEIRFIYKQSLNKKCLFLDTGKIGKKML